MAKVKFKIGTYKIIMITDHPGINNPKTYTKTLKGQMTKNFAVNYRTEDDRYYTVTHRPTGYCIHKFNYFQEAKTFIKLAETIPKIETMTLNNSRTFAPKLRELIIKVLYS